MLGDILSKRGDSRVVNFELLLPAQTHSSNVELIMTSDTSDPRPIAVRLWVSAFSLLALALFVDPSFAQQKSKTVVTGVAPLITRSVIREEVLRLEYGGTLTLVGAPEGSITIEGWPRSEVELKAVIELRAETEEDLNYLANVNGVVVDQDRNHVRILSTGTHDKVFMKRAARDFPRKLLGLPWKIDYRIRVPVATDLEINAGRGAITLSGVEGALSLSATESDAKMTLSGGSVIATLGSGKVDVKILARSWRGSGADIRIATGDLKIELPTGFNADIDADILRLGRIDDSYSALVSRERDGITDRIVRARAGVGGAFFKLVVGDGTIRIVKEGIEK